MALKDTLNEKTLELLGLKSKDMEVYQAVLRLGSAPLRRIAEEANLNRGTTYDALKRLLDVGLVSYVDAKTHRYFTGEDPQKLRGLATRREVAIQEAREKVLEAIPQLQEILGNAKHRPAVRYYEGDAGVRAILEDVLESTGRAESTEKEFYIYSSSALRDKIADAWPGFKKKRVKTGIPVKVISFGEGGETIGLDERKWLTKEMSAPTYIFLYSNKTAYIAADDLGKLFGVIIEGDAIASTQKMIFKALWETL